MIRVGVIGMSEGNGHPYSFSAITNGYSDDGFAEADWPVIHDYLKQRGSEEFGFGDVRVTHAWTQDPLETAKLCHATRIEHAVSEPEDLLGQVDAVLIARDDWRTHFPLGKLFLDAGLPVFIDKPLTLDSEELAYFVPYLASGKLMSCSGLRHARELGELSDCGALRCINGTVLLGWERYGVHLLDAVFATFTARPVSVARHPARHDSLAMAMDDGSVLTVNAIGSAEKTFRLDVFGDKGHAHVDMNDNFSAFRSTLARFYESCRTGVPAIDHRDTVLVMHTLMAGIKAEPGGPHVAIADIAVR